MINGYRQNINTVLIKQIWNNQKKCLERYWANSLSPNIIVLFFFCKNYNAIISSYEFNA